MFLKEIVMFSSCKKKLIKWIKFLDIDYKNNIMHLINIKNGLEDTALICAIKNKNYAVINTLLYNPYIDINIQHCTTDVKRNDFWNWDTKLINRCSDSKY